MAYRLIITEKAENDLDGIIGYIIEELCNETAAVHLLSEIERHYDILETNPHIYPVCQQLLLSVRGYRKVVIKNYILIIRIDEDNRIVYAERFFSQLEDYADKL